MPLPSLGRCHLSAPHNVNPDTVQRERSTYMKKREFKDASFLTRHPHISQRSIGLGRVDSNSGRDDDENQLVVISRVWKYPECRHGHDGERGWSCFSAEHGLGQILHCEPFWAEFSIKQELVTSISWYQCKFQLTMLNRTHCAELCMQNNGGDPGVFVRATEKP